MEKTIEKITSKILKGGEFIIKDSSYQDIFIQEEFTEDQKMMRNTIKDFIDKEVSPHKYDFENKDFALTERLAKRIGELGLLSIAIPEEYGGMGEKFTTTMLACDYVSSGSSSLATFFGANTGIGTMPIVLYGNHEQKKKYLPKLATGEWFASYCLTEPDAGSDANSGKTKAVLSEDGKYYSITGQKMWITNAGFAKVFIVFARIEDDKNITGFIVERDETNGMSFGEEENKLGIRSSSTRQVFFNNTKVPVENLLGERNGGFKIAMNALNIGRIKLAGACLEGQRKVINTCIKYAKERIQFNTPIASFGAIQQKITTCAILTFLCESGSYRVGKNIENKIAELQAQGLPHNEAELKGIEEYAIECSLLKVYASNATQKTADEGIQIFGGMGFSADAPMESSWRDSRIGRIYEGTNEINSLVAISMLIKKAMRGELDIISPATAVAKELTGIPSFDIPDYSELLSEEKEILGKLKKVFLMLAGSALQKYGKDMDQQQELILNIANILIEIYMAESAILRAEKLSANQIEHHEIGVAMAQLNLFNAVEIIKTKATDSIVSFAEGDEQKMLLSGLRRFTKYNNYPNTIALSKKIAQYLLDRNEYVFF